MVNISKLAIRNKSLDKRVKLTEEQKEQIRNLYSPREVTMDQLAEKFNVSKRLITFILNPERLDENKKRLKERGGSKIYYDKNKHLKYQDRYIKHKKELLLNNELNIEITDREKIKFKKIKRRKPKLRLWQAIY